jgi:FtsH-binding integral membrane protein
LVTSTDFANSIPFVIIAASSLIILILEAIFPKPQKHKAETAIFYFSALALAAALSFAFKRFKQEPVHIQ